MVTITFADRDTEMKALAVLIGRFPGKVLKSGEHIVPEPALDLLTVHNLCFTVLHADLPFTE